MIAARGCLTSSSRRSTSHPPCCWCPRP